MQLLLIAILSMFLLAAVVTFTVMGLAQWKRSRALGRWANHNAMRFSPDDTFDVPNRYGQFALISSGHSPCVHNVTYGRWHGLPVRAFDFHYEVGHGTRRITRRYSVVLVKSDKPLESLLLWRDTDFARIAQACADGKVSSWSFMGSSAQAHEFARICQDLDRSGACIEVADSTIMFGLPGSGRYDSQFMKIMEISMAIISKDSQQAQKR